MSRNPSSTCEVETFRGLGHGVTDANGLGYAFRKVELSIKALHGRKK